jgi:hypothetical protein
MHEAFSQLPDREDLGKKSAKKCRKARKIAGQF